MIVKNNLNALNANRLNDTNQAEKAKSTERLSSGRRINRSADDAAGLNISEKMRRQIWAMTQATANAQDGISSLQTAGGALDQVNEMLGRMSELALRAGNETLSAEDRSSIQSEMNALRSEIDRIAETTAFNDQKLLDGSFAEGRSIQAGAEVNDENRINIAIGRMDWESISSNGSHNVGDSEEIAATMNNITDALQTVSSMRSNIGATQNRLGNTVSNLRNAAENTAASESNVRDTDMAEEMIRFSLRNIMARSNEAMQAQANQSNQAVLSLLT